MFNIFNLFKNKRHNELAESSIKFLESKNPYIYTIPTEVFSYTPIEFFYDNDKAYEKHIETHWNNIKDDYIFEDIYGRYKSKLDWITLLVNKTFVKEEIVQKYDLINKINETECFLKEISQITNTHYKTMTDNYKSIVNGKYGEDFVSGHLNKYAKENNCIHISNIRLEVNGESIETDSIVITPAGVFSYEVKNYGYEGNFNIEITKDNKWYRVYNKNKYEMSNAFIQSDRHVYFTNIFLKEKFKEKNIPIYPVVVNANNIAKIFNYSTRPVYFLNNCTDILKDYQNKILSYDEMVDICREFLKYNLDPKKYSYIYFEKYFNNILEKLDEHFKYYDNIFEIIFELIAINDYTYALYDYNNNIIDTYKEILGPKVMTNYKECYYSFTYAN